MLIEGFLPGDISITHKNLTLLLLSSLLLLISFLLLLAQHLVLRYRSCIDQSTNRCAPHCSREFLPFSDRGRSFKNTRSAHFSWRKKVIHLEYMIDTKRLDVISQHQLLTWRREGRYEHSDSGIFSSFDRSPHAHSSIPPIHMGYQWPRDLHEQRSLHKNNYMKNLLASSNLEITEHIESVFVIFPFSSGNL